MTPDDASQRLVISAETFEMRPSSEHRGQYSFTWLSGPDPAYGFTVRIHGTDGVLSEDHMTDLIVGFLSNVDPETGHID